MQVIHSDKVVKFLKETEISFNVFGSLQETYHIASIFEPIKQGFYFLLGNNIPNEIESSLILVDANFQNERVINNNSAIVIDDNPQKVFYKILAHFFPTISTGEISTAAIVSPEAIIGKNVQIDPFCIIGKAQIGDNSIIRSHCYIHDDSIIEEGVTIESHSIIGAKGVAWTWNNDETERIIQPQMGGVHIEKNCFLGANTIVVRGSTSENTVIGENTLMAPGCRVGHGTRIGKFVHFANNIITGGNTVIGDYSFIGSAAVFRPKVKIHPNTIVGAGAVVVKNTSNEGLTLMGVPATETLTKANPSGMPKPKSNN